MTEEPGFAIGEVEALVLKAYRGAGFSWGMAQEAGRAAGWLARRQLPALDLFALLLKQTDAIPHDQLVPDINSDSWPAVWSNSAGLLCPVIAGVLLSDLAAVIVEKSAVIEKESTLTLESVAAPLILLPFVASLGVPVVIRATDIEVDVHGEVISLAGLPEQLGGKRDVVLELVDSRATSATNRGKLTEKLNSVHSTAASALRGVARPASIEFLENLAYHTYVPATQASRESGAGAGLNDDD